MSARFSADWLESHRVDVSTLRRTDIVGIGHPREEPAAPTRISQNAPNAEAFGAFWQLGNPSFPGRFRHGCDYYSGVGGQQNFAGRLKFASFGSGFLYPALHNTQVPAILAQDHHAAAPPQSSWVPTAGALP